MTNMFESIKSKSSTHPSPKDKSQISSKEIGTGKFNDEKEK